MLKCRYEGPVLFGVWRGIDIVPDGVAEERWSSGEFVCRTETVARTKLEKQYGQRFRRRTEREKLPYGLKFIFPGELKTEKI